ncbi:MAG TPA: hypothetical protein PK997_04935 [Candidatus Omnitrophota bacterium]|jgi:type IV pilus assembly protein PilB|nr:MAG: bacteriophage N4 adsorption protein B [Candidatus Omnitrophica bacterium ADurb.Bin314]HQB94540.1 hypothetical protein [Candidatus Omnitrophota bacterium]
MVNWRIGEILVRKKLIDWKQLEEALLEQEKTRESVGEVLVRRKFIPRFLLYKTLAERHAMPFADLSRIRIDEAAIRRVPQSIAQKHGIIPVEIRGRTLVIGIGDPTAAIPEAELATLAKVDKIHAVLCTPEAVRAAIAANYNGRKTGA